LRDSLSIRLFKLLLSEKKFDLICDLLEILSDNQISIDAFDSLLVKAEYEISSRDLLKFNSAKEITWLSRLLDNRLQDYVRKSNVSSLKENIDALIEFNYNEVMSGSVFAPAVAATLILERGDDIEWISKVLDFMKKHEIQMELDDNLRFKSRKYTKKDHALLLSIVQKHQV